MKSLPAPNRLASNPTQPSLWLILLLLNALACASQLVAAESIVISQPVPYQVVQRVGFVPQFAHEHHPGGAATGFGRVTITFDMPESTVEGGVLEYRLQLHEGATGREIDWTRMNFKVLPAEQQQTMLGVVQVDAGGWYRLEVRYRIADQIVAEGSVDPIGVGEVFVIAGQSYATNCNDEQLQVQDGLQRIAAFNHSTGTWQVANDPQPAGDGSDGGSIWPAFGDLLLPAAQVPIGLVNVAVGGTATSQWLPSGPLHQRLIKAGTDVGDFRAVLWQQGESDVIAGTSITDYIANMQAIRTTADQTWHSNRPWLLARSTLHPTVYNDPAGEGRIREAIDQLCQLPGFVHGPDTDVLSGLNRGPVGSRRHFTGIGQRNAAALWFATVWQLLSEPRPAHEQVLRSLPGLHLGEPAWNSEVVYRESSILLQSEPEGPLIARLGFRAAEILAVKSAVGHHQFDLRHEVKLSDDGYSVQFTAAAGEFVPPISTAELFPPQDAPHSYRHRMGHPEQNLLYQPGKWFHERNVEITYRRADLPPPDQATPATLMLPKTMKRLMEHQPLTLGISGDSISTGLDASLLTAAPPGQPGYADLVAADLQSVYGSEITVKNRAVAGWSVTHGHQDLDKLLAEKPQLIIVAYGMNDVGRRDPEWFAEQTRTLVERIQQVDPEIEIILVAPMVGNAEWIHTPREMFALYRDQLKSLTRPGVALADVTAVWQLLLSHKHDLDLTGNGLNHPNDFGHRLYAQSIVQLFPLP